MEGHRRKAPAKAKQSNVAASERVERQRVAIEQRREAERTAQRIVEELLEESGVPAELFRRAARYIDPLRYADVVEERSEVQHVCGYPLCGNVLGKIKTQRYHISLADHKVYDITERKRFCGDWCYKASKWYSSQLSTEPVWAREQLRLPPMVLWNEKIANSQDPPFGDTVDVGQPSRTLKDVITHPQVNADLNEALPKLSIREKDPERPGLEEETSTAGSSQERICDEANTLLDARREENVAPSVLLPPRKQASVPVVSPPTGLALLRATFVRWSSADSCAFLRGEEEQTEPFDLREEGERDKQGDEDVKQGEQKDKTTQTKKVERHAVFLPADSHGHQALRFDIVSERLNKALPVVLTCLQLPRATVTSDLHQVLRRFTFSRDNIMFSPDQWLVILLALLKALSCRSSSLAKAWQANRDRLLLLMQKLKVNSEDVDLLVETLTIAN